MSKVLRRYRKKVTVGYDENNCLRVTEGPGIFVGDLSCAGGGTGTAGGGTFNHAELTATSLKWHNSGHTSEDPSQIAVFDSSGNAAYLPDTWYEQTGVAATLIAAHVAASDPHTQYQRESEKDAANGYAGLSASTKLSGSQQTYGTTANTACEGNDSRLSNARTPVGTALTSANIWVGNGSNVAAAVAVSGDVTLTNAGVTAIGADKVTDTMLRNGAATSVIGRSANSSGDPADIVASSNDTFLQRVSNALSFGTLTIGMIPDSTITSAKISGQIAVAQGGTGAATLTAHGVLMGEGTSAIVASTAGTAGQVFTSGGSSADGSYQDVVTKTVQKSSLGSNHAITSANGTFETINSVSLTAGTWLIFAYAAVITQFSAGASGSITLKLRDTTTPADLPNASMSIGTGVLTNTRRDAQGTIISDDFTCSGTVTVELQACSNTATTWTTRIVTAPDTKIVAIKIAP